MNSSFNKEIQISDVNIPNRDIYTERSNNYDNKKINQASNIIKTLKNISIIIIKENFQIK